MKQTSMESYDDGDQDTFETLDLNDNNPTGGGGGMNTTTTSFVMASGGPENFSHSNYSHSNNNNNNHHHPTPNPPQQQEQHYYGERGGIALSTALSAIGGKIATAVTATNAAATGGGVSRRFMGAGGIGMVEGFNAASASTTLGKLRGRIVNVVAPPAAVTTAATTTTATQSQSQQQSQQQPQQHQWGGPPPLQQQQNIQHHPSIIQPIIHHPQQQQQQQQLPPPSPLQQQKQQPPIRTRYPTPPPRTTITTPTVTTPSTTAAHYASYNTTTTAAVGVTSINSPSPPSTPTLILTNQAPPPQVMIGGGRVGGGGRLLPTTTANSSSPVITKRDTMSVALPPSNKTPTTTANTTITPRVILPPPGGKRVHHRLPLPPPLPTRSNNNNSSTITMGGVNTSNNNTGVVGGQQHRTPSFRKPPPMADVVPRFPSPRIGPTSMITSTMPSSSNSSPMPITIELAATTMTTMVGDEITSIPLMMQSEATTMTTVAAVGTTTIATDTQFTIPPPPVAIPPTVTPSIVVAPPPPPTTESTIPPSLIIPPSPTPLATTITMTPMTTMEATAPQLPTVYSATTPPIYHNDIIPPASSSYMTECDVLSDYQNYVNDEDFPPPITTNHQPSTTTNNDVPLSVYTTPSFAPAAPATVAGGDGCGDMINNDESPPYFGSSLDHVQQQQQQQQQLFTSISEGESSPESCILVEHPSSSSSMVAEANMDNGPSVSTVVVSDRTNDYHTPQQLTTEDNLDPLSTIITAKKEMDEKVEVVPVLPEGWIECVDPTTSKVYYYNTTTEVSSWEWPPYISHPEKEEEVGGNGGGDDANNTMIIDDQVLNEVSVTTATVVDTAQIAATSVTLPTEEIIVPVVKTVTSPVLSVEKEEEDPTVSEELPEGWIMSHDDTTGMVYYYHEISGVSQWDRPIIKPTPIMSVSDAGTNNLATVENVISHENVAYAPALMELEQDHVDVPMSTMTDLSHDAVVPTSATINETPLVNNDDGLPVQSLEMLDVTPPTTKFSIDGEEESLANLSFESLPPNWIETVDPSSGKNYYYNELSGETTWDRPIMDDEMMDDVITDGVVNESKVDDTVLEVENKDNAADANQEEDHDSVGDVLHPASVVKTVHNKLPQGLDEAVDESGETYYYHEVTGETTWEMPVSEESAVVADPASVVAPSHAASVNVGNIDDPEDEVDDADVDNPESVTTTNQQQELQEDDEWIEATDPTSGDTYYYNSTTGETSWTKPKPQQNYGSSGEEEEEILLKVKENEVEVEGEPEMQYVTSNVGVAKAPASGESLGWTRVDHPSPASNQDNVVAHSASGDENDDVSPKEGWAEITDKVGALDITLPHDNYSRKDVSVDEGSMTGVDVPEATHALQEQDVQADQAHIEEDWIEATDPTSGNIYYYNSVTGETSWTKPEPRLLDDDKEAEFVETEETALERHIPPEDSVGNAEQPAPDDDHYFEEVDNGPETRQEVAHTLLPEGWVEVKDQTSGMVYYYNETSGETTWDCPARKELLTAKEDPITVSKTCASVSQPHIQVRSSVDRHSRPAHAIATFGFGGRLCTMIPRVAASLSGIAPKRGQDRPTLRRGPVVIHRVCGLIPRDHEYSIPSNATAPFAPLINSQEDQVLLHLDTMSSSNDNLLWNIINIAAQNKGRLRNDKKAKKAIVDLLLASKDEGRKRGVTEMHVPSTSLPTLDLTEVQDLLLRGERESAVSEALTQKNFALALVIASMCDRTTYRITARRFADEALPVGSPLHTATLLFSDNLEVPDDDELLDPYGKRVRRKSFWYDDATYGNLIETWKEQLASIMCNQTAGWERIVVSLGDRLLQLGQCHAAHVCYLVSFGQFGPPSKHTTRLALLGCDHRNPMNQMLMTPQSIQSYERTEAFEWARRRGNRKTHIPSLQPFKLRYAELLADFGYEELAREYLLNIHSCIGLSSDNKASDSPGAAATQDPNFIESLKLLDDRICGLSGAKQLSWESNNKSKSGVTSLALGTIVKSVLGKKSTAEVVPPKKTKEEKQDAIFAPLDDDQIEETSPQKLEPSIPPRHLVEQQKKPPTSNITPVVASLTTKPSSKSSTQVDTPKSFPSNPFSHNTTPANFTTAKQTSLNQSDVTADKTPKLLSGFTTNPFSNQNNRELDEHLMKTIQQVQEEEKKDDVIATPSQKVEMKKAPVSEPPRSTGWFSKLLGRGDTESKATVADVGEEMQAYYDEKLKRWIFPGDDPTEVAKPLAPPPIIPTSSADSTATLIPTTPAPSSSGNNDDPLAALMAPPPSRGIPSSMKQRTAAMTSTTTSTGGGGGVKKKTGTPPISSPMINMPTYSVFQPKPASSAVADMTT